MVGGKMKVYRRRIEGERGWVTEVVAIPSYSLRDVAFVMRRLRHSTTRLKRKGDNGSSCQRPRCSLNGGEGEPFTRMDDDADMT